jgi:predicted PilT family ATPase
MEENTGVWMSILEYASFKSISISTIRRYIKAGRVKTKKDDGKFYIYVSPEKIKDKNSKDEAHLRVQLENERLKMKIKSLEEELNDMKMLVRIYEQNQHLQRQEPPEIPTM